VADRRNIYVSAAFGRKTAQLPCDVRELPKLIYFELILRLFGAKLVQTPVKQCGIEMVAMESTGVYWIPVYEMLEQAGFNVLLVNARHVKNVSAHKTDVLDCQWLQQLASYGLLKGAFRPSDTFVKLRAFIRQRSMLIESAASHVLHMQKALTQMNIHLHNVIADITGETGSKIICAIIAGERNPAVLSSYRSVYCHNSEEVIQKSLEGNYRDEHVFALKQARELYDFYHKQISACDLEIQKTLACLESGVDEQEVQKILTVPHPKRKRERKHDYAFDLTQEMIRICGVDLTRIPGISSSTAITVVSEIGTDMNKWRSAKHFASWLGLSPGNRVSGGKRLSGRTKKCSNKVAIALRMSATTLWRSNCAFGAYLRRLKARLGSPKAITAMAHKLAVVIYSMLKHGKEYFEKGMDYYEKMYRDRVEKNLRKRAKEFGFELVRKISSNQNAEMVI
jgi:transposase